VQTGEESQAFCYLLQHGEKGGNKKGRSNHSAMYLNSYCHSQPQLLSTPQCLARSCCSLWVSKTGHQYLKLEMLHHSVRSEAVSLWYLGPHLLCSSMDQSWKPQPLEEICNLHHCFKPWDPNWFAFFLLPWRTKPKWNWEWTACRCVCQRAERIDSAL